MPQSWGRRLFAWASYVPLSRVGKWTQCGYGQRELRVAAPPEHFINLRQVHFLATNFAARKLF